MIDDGWMILTGFNPVSLMGLRKLVPVLRKTTPYNSRMFTLTRQLDWLALLNFEVLHYGRYQVLPSGMVANSQHSSAGTGQFAADCCPEADGSADVKPDEVGKSKTQLRQTVGATRQWRNGQS